MAQSIVDLGCPPDKIRINRLGIETEHIAYRPRQWTPGEKLRVLIAAGFVEKKGIPSAVRALAKIKDEVPLEVTIIGDARAERQSQAEKQRILDAISESGLGERVRRLGFQPHRKMIEEAYRNHIFLSPSITASDGDTEAGTVLAIIEMIATGMPVVSTRHCDIPTTIEHGRTGFLAEEGDVEGIANGLRALIAEPGRWKAITDAARQHMERDFNAASQGVELAGLYAEVMARRAAAARSEA
jgi:colanic acid/amylovoran biosynthesis glycosyltransferase